MPSPGTIISNNSVTEGPRPPLAAGIAPARARMAARRSAEESTFASFGNTLSPALFYGDTISDNTALAGSGSARGEFNGGDGAQGRRRRRLRRLRHGQPWGQLR